MRRTGLTTLIYLERDDKYLMMHRISKKNDINKDKWIGVGGHFEDDEQPSLVGITHGERLSRTAVAVFLDKVGHHLYLRQGRL